MEVKIESDEIIDFVLYFEQLIDCIENPQNSNEFYRKTILENSKEVVKEFKDKHNSLEFYNV